MICDRAERRVGGASAPVFGGGFLGFPRKVGYLIGGFLSPSRKNGLMIGDGRRRLRRSAFCRADPAGQPSPPLCGSAAFLGQRGCKVGYLIGGILSPSRKNGLMIGSADGGCAARLFVGLPCRAALPRFAAPPPFWGQRGYISAAKRGKISGAPGPAR